MEDDKQIPEQMSVQLRQELKIWEKQFATDNGGRKAGRADIKANTAIGTFIYSFEASRLTRHLAAKYKEYNKLRELLSAKETPQQPAATTAKRHATSEYKQSPPKRSKTPEATPEKQQRTQMDDPAEHIEFATPVVKRLSFGPTPQKDGQVLGIFDLLPGETPSRLRTVLGDVNVNVARTPSKNPSESDDGLVEERLRRSRTPLSTGKRFMLDSFVTPKKRKDNEASTPSSSMKEFETPSFLRRDIFALSTVLEEPQSPEMARPWKRRSFGRSLSGMVKEMRKQEEEKADEEWEIMREMEETDYRAVVGKKPAAPKTLVEDSQIQLDVDGFVPSDFESDADEKTTGSKPRKAWKKKGLKRQTRRVIMRPVTILPQQAQAPEPHSESDNDEEDVPEDIVQDTQIAPKLPDSGYLSGGDEDAGYDYEDVAHGLPDEDVKTKTESESRSTDKRKKGTSKTEDNPATKPGKKIDPNSQKHANFQRLKIRGKGPANGRTGGRGRFGRKR
jgi:hypothetical protein